jgi:hypothetical protein
LKRNISKIIPRKRIFEILASFSFGITASALLSIIAFKSTAVIPSWVLPTTWAIFAVSIILGFSFLILDHQQKQIIEISVKDVLEDMEEIEENFNIK